MKWFYGIYVSLTFIPTWFQLTVNGQNGRSAYVPKHVGVELELIRGMQKYKLPTEEPNVPDFQAQQMHVIFKSAQVTIRDQFGFDQ